LQGRLHDPVELTQLKTDLANLKKALASANENYRAASARTDGSAMDYYRNQIFEIEEDIYDVEERITTLGW